MAQDYPYLDFYINDGTGVAVEQWVDSWSVGMHRHQYCELILVDKGSMRHEYNQVETLLIPGDVVIVGRNNGHGYLLSGEVSIYNCQFAPDDLDADVIRNIAKVGLLENQDKIRNEQPFTQAVMSARKEMACENLPDYTVNSSKQGIVHLTPVEKNYFVSLMNHMMEEQEREKPSRMLKRKYMEIILLELKKKVQHLDSDIRASTPGSQNAIARILAEMEADMTKPFDIQETAKRYSFSPNHLRKLFKDITGTTPVQYLNRIRCMRACEMIQQGMSVTEAAEAVGFYDISYFSRVFKKHIGCPPTGI